VEDYYAQYGLVALLTVVAVAVPVGMLLVSRIAAAFLVRPNRPSQVKQDMYECGMEPIGGRWIQFNFRYYVFALLFVIFDVLALLMYPWAVHFKDAVVNEAAGGVALSMFIVFIAPIAVGWLYAWKKQALEWD
jgi:NADH-quinone oxidoreductase subunit A